MSAVVQELGSHLDETKQSRHSRLLTSVGMTIGSLALTELAARHHYRTGSKEASIIKHDHKGDKTIYTIPGCRSNGEMLADMLEPQFSQFGSTRYLVYPTEKFSLGSIRRRLLEAREDERDKPATVYAVSMGGIVYGMLSQDAGFRRDFGDVDSVILDSSPADGRDIQSGAQKAKKVAKMFNHNQFASSAALEVYRHVGVQLDHDDTITDEQMRDYRRHTVSTPLGVVAAQTTFIDNSYFAPLSLADVDGKWFYVDAEADSVINTTEAHRKYEQALGRTIERVTDPARRPRSHAEGYAHQTAIIERIAS